jgi:apolipoprotein N-acyltransferase
VLAYPLLWTALDTLLAHLHPDTNWNSLAYSQADMPAAVQIVALTGVPGLVFVLSWVPAALALVAVRGWPAARYPAIAALALAGASFAFGLARISSARARRRPTWNGSGRSMNGLSSSWPRRVPASCCCPRRSPC